MVARGSPVFIISKNRTILIMMSNGIACRILRIMYLNMEPPGRV
jgi:hypothetical protein